MKSAYSLIWLVAVSPVSAQEVAKALGTGANLFAETKAVEFHPGDELAVTVGPYLVTNDILESTSAFNLKDKFLVKFSSFNWCSNLP